ncbi:MAG: hypothetical protein IKJ65_05585 [Clostridia bacterium]|nr:hypothetical protein [Clostridia bacterium]
MKRAIVVWGAGRIGRGFVADIFNHEDWQTVFVDIDQTLIDRLNAAKKYAIHKATKDGITQTIIENGFTALHTSDQDALKALFLTEGLMLDIAVHAPKLPEVADQIAPLIEFRAKNAAHLPMDVMMNVNMAAPDEWFISLLEARLSAKALSYFKEKVGVTGIFAMCISPVAPESIQKNDPLALWNNGFHEQAIDKNRLKCPPPVLPRLRLTDDVAKEETRKLYTLNMAHALICYLGLKKGLETSFDAVNDKEVRQTLLTALEEASFGLIGEYGFYEEEMSLWRETIVGLLENPYIKDDLKRLGADTKRKLGAYDRLVGPARLSAKHGRAPYALSKAIRAGFDYENDDEGTKAVRECVKANGAEKAAEIFSKLLPGDGIFDLVF